MWADYLPPPKNEFLIKVNGEDYYALPKEDVDFDPSKVEAFKCENLEVNDSIVLYGIMAWVPEKFEKKLNSVYRGVPLESI